MSRIGRTENGRHAPKSVFELKRYIGDDPSRAIRVSRIDGQQINYKILEWNSLYGWSYKENPGEPNVTFASNDEDGEFIIHNGRTFHSDSEFLRELPT